MLNKNSVVFWNVVEYDLYIEANYTFGVEFDLFNNHKVYYCKKYEENRTIYQYLADDIYEAIDEFNKILEIEVEKNEKN